MSVGVSVAVDVKVAVGVEVQAMQGVFVGIGVFVGVGVLVGVGVFVGVGVAPVAIARLWYHPPAIATNPVPVGVSVTWPWLSYPQLTIDPSALNARL